MPNAGRSAVPSCAASVRGRRQGVRTRAVCAYGAHGACRTGREAERQRRSKRRFGLLLTGVAVLLLFFMVIYPRVTALMRQARQAPVPAAAVRPAPASDLDQSGITDIEWQQMPVTVVPNDYQGE